MSTRRQRERLRLAKIARDVARDAKMHNESIDKMTKAQLIEYAEEHGIEVDRAAKKAEIREAINKE